MSFLNRMVMPITPFRVKRMLNFMRNTEHWQRTPKVHFVGRLATYKYYNMDQIVAQSLTTYGKIMSVKRSQAVVMTPGRLGNGNCKVSNEKVLRQKLALTGERGMVMGKQVALFNSFSNFGCAGNTRTDMNPAGFNNKFA